MNKGESILLTEENLWFFVLPLKNAISNVQYRKGASRMPVLLSKSGVRSSHVSSSLGRRIQSAHLLCNFHKREKKKEGKDSLHSPYLQDLPHHSFLLICPLHTWS